MSEAKNTIVKELILSDFTKDEILKASIGVAYDLGLPMAIWRLPNQNEINFICSFREIEKLASVELKDLPAGFIFSKFNSDDGKYFVKGDISISFDYNEVLTKGLDTKEGNEFKSRLFEELILPASKSRFFTSGTAPQQTLSDYQEIVKKAIAAIRNDEFEKVVPARTKAIGLSQDFDVINLFLSLAHAYENAFISFVSVPTLGTWLGASPETLIKTEGNIFSTVSLAGTRKLENKEQLSETSWNQKEIEEQAMVSRYVVNCFKKIRLREFEEKGPKTTKAGNLLHLKTTFKVDMEKTNFQELPSVMLDLLHPTSAVAGMPKAPALAFLNTHEGLDRSFYSGYLGPVNVQNTTHIFVNLRCMQIFKEKALLYAGAGVTEDSNPEKEYLETEMKCNTLLNKIGRQI